MAPRTPKDPEKTKPARPAKTAKPTRKAAAQPAGKAAAKTELTVVKPAAAEATSGIVKLKDLVETVATATGGKKPDVKAAVEATLDALGKALVAGQSVAVPPLGKLRVVKTKGPALTVKLRLPNAAKPSGLALAEDGEDS